MLTALEAIERDGGAEGVSQRAMLRANNAYQIEDDEIFDEDQSGQMRVSDTFFVNDDEDEDDDFGYHD